MECSGLKQRVGLDARRRRRVDGNSAPLVVVLVKSINIAVETENALVVGIIVPQPAKIFNLGGRDHTRSIRQHNGVSRGDNRHVVVESGAKRSDEDEARNHGERTV
jgi:hypothetical protein